MFKGMRRKERQIENNEIEEILAKGEYGVLASSGENGYAYAVPLSYVYIDNAIYFHCALEGQKLDNIKFNPKVSFCVVGDTEILPDKFSTKYESIIAFGIASVLEGEEKINALKLIVEKYSKDFMKEGLEYINRAHTRTALVKLDIEHVTGKARQD